MERTCKIKEGKNILQNATGLAALHPGISNPCTLFKTFKRSKSAAAMKAKIQERTREMMKQARMPLRTRRESLKRYQTRRTRIARKGESEEEFEEGDGKQIPCIMPRAAMLAMKPNWIAGRQLGKH
jgi:hypothetical protein